MPVQFSVKAKTAIQKYVERHCAKGQAGYSSSSADEDTVTGDFCGNLRTSLWKNVPTAPSVKWRIDYKKLRGRGPNAPEKKYGADGILQIRFEDAAGRVTGSKGLLFQAKMHKDKAVKRLLKQVSKMDGLLKGAGVVFEFGPNGYRAVAGKHVIAADGRLSAVSDGDFHPLCRFLSEQFIGCTQGIWGLRFEPADAKHGDRLFLPGKATPILLGDELQHEVTIRVRQR